MKQRKQKNVRKRRNKIKIHKKDLYGVSSIEVFCILFIFQKLLIILQSIKVIIFPFLQKKFVVRALLDYLTVVEQNNIVGVLNC